MTPCVLLVVSSLSAGGAERVVSELAGLWAEKNWRIGVLTLSVAGNDHYDLDPRVHRIVLNVLWKSMSPWQSVTGNLRRSRMLRKAILEFGPDVVLSFVDQTNVRVLAALLGASTPVVVSERVDPREYRLGIAWRAARRLLYPSAAAVVVQTRSVAIWAEGLVPRSKIRVIPNFVRRLRPPAVAKEPERIILGVGRLARQKGFDLLLRAYSKSVARAAGYRLVILGEGGERAALESLVAQLGIADRVELPGIVRFPEDWMERASVFVLPSRFEGFPNALVEAMAMGCAVIAADCASGPREIVRHEQDGVLVPPEDAAVLADALSRVIEDHAFRERLRANAVMVRERFAVPGVLGQWETVIHAAMGND